ncbi:MAG: histidinol-phosphatase [Pseudomonadota bacterium]
MSLSGDDIDLYTSFAERLADAARAETLPRFRAGTRVVNKAGIWFDPVTEADREAERAQRRLIAAAFPKHGVIGEEFGADAPDAPLRWVLDPVDGTRGFICGVPTWTTLVALEDNETPIIGVIDQAYTDERWIGAPAGTVFVRDGARTPCRVSDVDDLARARISTTDPRSTAFFTSGEAQAFERVAAAARVARFGLDAYAYALLASGELDLVIEAGLQHYDYAALKPVIEGAGGVLTDWNGGPVDAAARGRTLAAATPALHAEAMAVLNADGGF